MKIRRLIVLFGCLFLVMVGYGITLPVLPLYVERLAAGQSTLPGAPATHVGLITGVYPLMQFFFAPLWGRYSDKLGRKPLLLLGVAGFAVAQTLFGLAGSLLFLYGARILGGILSSATFPALTAYVADSTSEEARNRGLAWQGTASSLGVVVGPAFGAALSRQSWQPSFGYLKVDSFSIPFLAAAALAAIAVFAAWALLPESLLPNPVAAHATGGNAQGLAKRLWPLLGLAFAGQFGLSIFEATFALHAKTMLDYGPMQISMAFTTCAVVMSIFQGGAVVYLGRWLSEQKQLATGFGMMGTALMFLVAGRKLPVVLIVVGWLALGMALVAPNVAALVSKRGSDATGTAIGLQNAANSLGQFGGPVAGGVLFSWGMPETYTLAGAVLVAVSVIVYRRVIIFR